MSRLGYTDKPVENLTEDSFGIGTYINGLCQFIVSCDTPMTISIQGDWGSGKTSMMNMIKQQIEDKVYPIWFNTWQYSQFNMGNDLCLSFLENLITKLQSKAETATSKILETSLKILKIGAKTAISSVGLDGAAIVNVFDKQDSDIAKAVNDLKDAFQESVNNKLKDNKKDRVVIFVDDLDRLNPGKAVELLEVLKVFLDCENCVFILAVDYSVVTAGVRQKFGNLVDEDKGKSFFDKIIQLPFKMPVAQYDINKYIYDMLKKMNMRADSRIVQDYKQLIRNSIGFNPRSIKRLFNTYQLLNLISDSKKTSVREDLHQRLLFAIICMQMTYEHLYAFIVTSAKNDELTGKGLRTLADPEVVRNYKGLPEELRLIGKDGKIDEDELIRMCAFMKTFVSIVDIDKDKLLSDEELDDMKEILFFSSVTSIMEEAKTGTGMEADQKIRARNRAIIDDVDANLTNLIGDFEIWQPLKSESDTKMSDVRCSINLITVSGIPFKYEFSISSKTLQDICLFIKFTCAQENLERLKEFFGPNPLDNEIPPVINDKGYEYVCMNIPEDKAVEVITEKVKEVHGKLKTKGYIV